jgi:hypothetical protein
VRQYRSKQFCYLKKTCVLLMFVFANQVTKCVDQGAQAVWLGQEGYLVTDAMA